MAVRDADPTYYDQPLLQEPVWEWSIPTYYYVGGVTGAALVLSAAVQLTRASKLDKLVTRCRWIGLTGCAISAALLINDLGRPSRFFHMLRVFRPTSPMNVGSWILSATGGAVSVAVLFRGTNSGDIAGYICGLCGMGLATYTGVLTGNTAVPVWQASRRVLPILFGASAVASAGSLFDIIANDPNELRVTKTFKIAGQVAEICAARVMETKASVVPRVGRPLKRGLSGVLWRTASVLTATSLVVAFLPNGTRGKRVVAGVLGTFGSLLTRFAVERAGVASSRDARASFHQQRAGT